jgi:hypothetical protein
MLYVERSETGNIIAIHKSPQGSAGEEKSDIDEEILDFLTETTGEDPRKLLLSLSDRGVIRLVEDLIDLLIRKNIIFYTELPEHAREKIRQRARLRENIICQTLTVDDIL